MRLHFLDFCFIIINYISMPCAFVRGSDYMAGGLQWNS